MTRIFKDCVEAVDETTREVFSRGVECFDKSHQAVEVSKEEFLSKELVAYTYKISNPSDPGEAVDWAREHFGKDYLTPEYAEEWWQEMKKGGINPGEAHLAHRPEYWKKFGIEEDGKFSYSYSERMESSLPKVIEKLKESPFRRAAFIPIWFEKDVDRIGERRTPCSIGYHFLVRREGMSNKLHLQYLQRSCDLVSFFPLDLYRAVRLMDYVSWELGIEKGILTHFISSLHAFKKDIKDKTRLW